jgi:NADH:ubiquinone oxidoreductase subunit 5 (subunit L)/multisubunit Na+/H+ antiporter MnhA subunit
MRRMGGFYKYLPFEAAMSFIALWNLSGLAFSLGFYMKHFLLINSSPDSYFNLVCFILTLIGSLSGLLYSFKLYYYVFFDFKKGRKNVYNKLPNDLNKNIFYTNASLASNVAISLLCVSAYFLCGYLIYKYITTHNVHFDWSYFYNPKNNLKNFYTPFFMNFHFYLN